MLYARDFRRLARERLRGRYWSAVAVVLLVTLLGGTIYCYFNGAPQLSAQVDPSGLLADPNALFDNPSAEELLAMLLPAPTAAFLLFNLYSFAAYLCGGAAGVGLCRYNLALFDGAPADLSAVRSGFHSFGRALGARFLCGLFIALWSLLFVIPGIIASYAYVMVGFVLSEDPSIGVLAAIRVSKRMMKGNKWRLFCLQFSFLGWSLLASLPAGILTAAAPLLPWSRTAALLAMLVVTLLTGGILMPYINAATTAFYLEVSGQSRRLGAAPQP